MGRLIVFFGIILFYLIRYLILSDNKKDTGFLFVSIFLLTLPFGSTFFHIPLMPESRTGAFNMTLSIEPYIILIILLIIAQIAKGGRYKLVPVSKIIYCLIFIFLISFFNSNNYAVISTLTLFLRVFFIIYSFYLISQSFDLKTINKGIFDALGALVVLQFFLSICYPILGITQFLSVFRGDEVIEWATGDNRGGRLSAMGIFAHPGNLALFVCITGSYFLGSYLKGYKKRLAMLYLFFSVIVLYLTYSRSGLLSFIASSSVIILLYKNPKKSIFSIKNIILAGTMLVVILFVIIKFTSLGDFFVNDNFEDMEEARMLHWVAGIEIFLRHPFFGVGLNSHLEYLRLELPILKGFFAENPIHNIHIIILSETGLIGLLLWLFFYIYNIEKSRKILIVSQTNDVYILNIAFIGVLISWFIYGFFGWAPFNADLLSPFLFITYFAIFSRNLKRDKV